MNHPADFHIHPDYSIDARGSIIQYCRRAVEIGLKSICFTTHYDVNPRRTELDGYWHYHNSRARISDKLIGIYLDEIETALTNFPSAKLQIYRGLEVDYFPGVEREIERLKANFPFDFLIGSVHCLDDIAISDKREAPAYFNRKTLTQMTTDYFALLKMAAESPGLDAIGHLDYYIRYYREYYGADADRIDIEQFDPIFDVLKRLNRGFEINTSPFRYGLNNFHPNKKIIERAVNSGVKISSIGSDSHKPEKLALGVNEAYEFLNRIDIIPEFPKAE